MNYSVVIVTFKNRFEKYFKPLIVEIKKQRPEVEVIIQCNGDYQEQFDENYRKDILLFLSEYSNTFIQMYVDFNSLSKLWNRGIQMSSNDKCLVLNDDITIKNGFFDFIDNKVSDIKEYSKINSIFSHFLISRDFLKKYNWFDERFLGIGWEDWDLRNKITPGNFNTSLIESFHSEDKNPQQKNVSSSGGKYYKFNHEFYNEKWINKKIKEEIQYPYYDFEKENKFKL